MTVQRVAMVFGIVFLLIGILGFVTSGMDMTADPETAPLLLGLFPVNAVHNGVHIGFGIWGLLAARSWEGARNYARIGGVLYLILGVLGFIAPSTFGLIPIGGNNIWLHALMGLVLAAAGFTAKPSAVTATT
jgi:hypothetical protein